jgi:hypothetical protein
MGLHGTQRFVSALMSFAAHMFSSVHVPRPPTATAGQIASNATTPWPRKSGLSRLPRGAWSFLVEAAEQA